MVQNRFFVKGEGEILYNYNNGLMAADPKVAAQNFIHALDSMPRLLEKYKAENERISKDISVLKEVVEAVWRIPVKPRNCLSGKIHTENHCCRT